MKCTRFICTLTLFSSFGLLFSQKTKETNDKGIITENLPALVSKTYFTETPQVPVKLENAHYDFKRKNIPYFLNSKTIALNNSLQGNLKNIFNN